MRTAWVFAAMVVLGACLNGSPVLGQDQEQAESPAGQGDSSRVWGHVERPHDAPMPAPKRPPAPHGARSIYVRGPFTSVQVNVDAGGANIPGDAANEPSIAVDPNEPDKMAIGWRQFDAVSSNFRQAGWAYTQDGGTTWTFPGVLDPGQFRSDPVLGYDAEGNFYFNSLAASGSAFWCTVFKSTDGGVTWDSGTFAQGGDKQWMAIDRTGGIGHGNIYAAWNLSYSACPGDFTVSYDGGQSFEDCASMPGSPIWGTLAVGPDGTLFISGTGMELVRSSTIKDSSLPPAFDLATTVDLDGTLAFSGGPNPGGLLGQCWIAVDHSGGPTNGNLYMLASVQRFSTPDPLDVMFARSTDGGLTWSAPVRINDDAEDNNAYQWFSTMSVAPNGRIDAVWNDTRNNIATSRSEVYYSYSTDGGLTWTTNVPVTPSFSPFVGYPNQNKLGDYYDMISHDEEVHLAYAATLNGEQDVYYVRLFPDCNENGIFDATDISAGTSLDCGGNGMPDECEPDCNNNGAADSCDLSAGTSGDCNGNMRPDECDPNFDCNGNDVQDICDVAGGTSADCSGNEVPDECELDCDNDGVPDSCDPPPVLADVFTNESARVGAWIGLTKGAPIAQDIHLDGPISLYRFTVAFRAVGTCSPATLTVRFFSNNSDDTLLPDYPSGLLGEYVREERVVYVPGPQEWGRTLPGRIGAPADLWMEIDFDLYPGHPGWGRGQYGVYLLGGPPTIGSSHGLVHDRENDTTQDATYLDVSLRGFICTDCNENGLHDACDVECNQVGGACNLLGCGLSPDCNTNGVPDECDPDADGDLVPDACDACPDEPALSEPDEPGGEVSCLDGVDNDCDGSTDAADSDCAAFCPYTCGDIDGSGGAVGLSDFATFAVCYGRSGPAQQCTATDFACSDLNGSGLVDLNDFATFANIYGKTLSNSAPDCGG
ncbi:MAG: hypothetical protein JSU68_05525 [Phycisphaerales bacterium]|nr:MAG: hypothetical protein JSU68_05525 [Phycisphaerales bacterium]